MGRNRRPEPVRWPRSFWRGRRPALLVLRVARRQVLRLEAEENLNPGEAARRRR
ncbi:hypothetical protein ABZ619_37230 [Streptomyces sp. NPDC007851]|uniref:hypothetical protein n=1 Tax=Streptomyces sp. NPDC007851 TaxID=3155008 RepID=UPI00340BA748